MISIFKNIFNYFRAGCKCYGIAFPIFALKLGWLLFKYRGRIKIGNGICGIGKGVTIRIDASGLVELGNNIYISKRTDIHALGGIVRIGDNTFINKDCTIVSRKEIAIGADCLLGEAVSIYDHNHNLINPSQPIVSQGFTVAPVRIGNNVWLGCKTFIKSGLQIGDNVIVGANSVVTKSINNNHIAYGNPAKAIPNPNILEVD